MQTEPSLRTPSLRIAPKMNSDVGSSSFLMRPLKTSYACIPFPSKKWFRMSQNVINQRMLEFTGKSKLRA